MRRRRRRSIIKNHSHRVLPDAAKGVQILPSTMTIILRSMKMKTTAMSRTPLLVLEDAARGVNQDNDPPVHVLRRIKTATFQTTLIMNNERGVNHENDHKASTRVQFVEKANKSKGRSYNYGCVALHVGVYVFDRSNWIEWLAGCYFGIAMVAFGIVTFYMVLCME
jgi:hypothetical protein